MVSNIIPSSGISTCAPVSSQGETPERPHPSSSSSSSASQHQQHHTVLVQPRGTCDICFLALPVDAREAQYNECCGQEICNGCVVAEQRTRLVAAKIIHDGIHTEEEEFALMYSERFNVCPYCRAKPPNSNQIYIGRLRTRVSNDNDDSAMVVLGEHYREGQYGLPTSSKKAEELFQQAYDLGNRIAAWNLYCLDHSCYDSDSEVDEEKKMEYLQEGALRGNIDCVRKLACTAYESGQWEISAGHLKTAASCGHDTAMDNLRSYYKCGHISKDDYATTLRVYQAANDEIRSPQRDYALRYCEQYFAPIEAALHS